MWPYIIGEPTESGEVDMKKEEKEEEEKKEEEEEGMMVLEANVEMRWDKGIRCINQEVFISHIDSNYGLGELVELTKCEKSHKNAHILPNLGFNLRLT